MDIISEDADILFYVKSQGMNVKLYYNQGILEKPRLMVGL